MLVRILIWVVVLGALAYGGFRAYLLVQERSRPPAAVEPTAVPPSC